MQGALRALSSCGLSKASAQDATVGSQGHIQSGSLRDARKASWWEMAPGRRQLACQAASSDSHDRERQAMVHCL